MTSVLLIETYSSNKYPIFETVISNDESATLLYRNTTHHKYIIYYSPHRIYLADVMIYCSFIPRSIFVPRNTPIAIPYKNFMNKRVSDTNVMIIKIFYFKSG